MNITQKRNVGLFFSGRLISLIGSGIQMIAIPLYILDLTGSGALMGVFAMLSMAPSLLTAPLAGVLGDRLNRKKIAVAADYSRGVLILAMAGLAMLGKMNLAVLFICQVMISIMDSLFNAATAAMLPELIDEADISRVTAFRGGTDSISMIVGPALGGIIYGFWGIKMIFFLNALSFIISAFCETFLQYRARTGNAENLSIKSFFHENHETVAYIFQHLGLKQLFFFAMVINFLANPILMVGTPFVLKKVIGFSNLQYSYLMTLFMLGILCGNILISSLFAKTNPGKLLKLGLIINAPFFIIYGLMIIPKAIRHFAGASWTYFTIMGIGFVIAGLLNALVNTPISTNLQKMVQDKMRARFFALLNLFSQLAVPVGSVIFGLFLDKIATYSLFMIIGSLFFIITIGFVVISSPEVYEPYYKGGLETD